MNSLILLTQNTGRILGPIAQLLGIIMNWIYMGLEKIGIANVALTIIVFTIIIYCILLPLTYKQQKFSKMSQIMNPEIQAVQKKYKNRKDQASMAAMQEETQAIYKKYGVSPSGSCVYMIIQLPILFALYRVIYNVPAYITSVKDTFAGVVDGIMTTKGFGPVMQEFLTTVAEKNSVFRGIGLNLDGGDATANSIIDILYKCSPENWNLLADKFSALSDQIHSTATAVQHFNNFLGISIVSSPKTVIVEGFHNKQFLFILIGILVPLVSCLSQFLNLRLMPQPENNGGQGEQMANQMKTMNYMMPLYSLFIVLFLPVGVGIYWIAGSLIRSLQQWVLNKRFDKMDLDKVIKENEEKYKAKQKAKIEKAGVKGEQITNAAKINTKNIDSQRKSMADKANVSNYASYNNEGKKFKEGSLAAKANKVKQYNDKNTK